MLAVLVQDAGDAVKKDTLPESALMLGVEEVDVGGAATSVERRATLPESAPTLTEEEEGVVLEQGLEALGAPGEALETLAMMEEVEVSAGVDSGTVDPSGVDLEVGEALEVGEDLEVEKQSGVDLAAVRAVLEETLEMEGAEEADLVELVEVVVLEAILLEAVVLEVSVRRVCFCFLQTPFFWLYTLCFIMFLLVYLFLSFFISQNGSNFLVNHYLFSLFL